MEATYEEVYKELFEKIEMMKQYCEDGKIEEANKVKTKINEFIDALQIRLNFYDINEDE